MSIRPTALLFALVLVTLVVTGCGTAGEPSASGQLRVVATTTILGDVVAQVGGEHIALSVLMPAGSDPHSFQPVPRDAGSVAAADLVVINGLGFESFLEDLIANAGADAQVVSASEGMEALALAAGGKEDDHGEGEYDPHVWFDAANVLVWAENIRAALSAADPTHAVEYGENAGRFAAELEELDRWIELQVERVPPGRRQLVTDHAVLGYFARRYGFDQVGAVIPAFSTAASPSAREMADLQAAISALDVPAIFVGTTVNPSTAEQIAADTGVQVVRLYTGSLSDPDGPAGSYLAFMRYNVTAIVTALAP